ncbi:MAG: hypothetical protein ACFB10_24135 [Salibacteraceae bacterium]
MKNVITNTLDLMQAGGIRYYLLRPVDLREELPAEIDLIVPKEDLPALCDLLRKKEQGVRINTFIAKNTVQIHLGQLTLDVKTKLCFLPTKTLEFFALPPFCGYRITDEQLLIPDTGHAYLFTFWSLHLFLDKHRVEDSSSFHIYLQFFANQQKWVRHHHFEHWAERVFGENAKHFIFLVDLLITDGPDGLPLGYQHSVKSWWKETHPLQNFSYYPQKWKYGIYRRLGLSTFQQLPAAQSA